MAVSGKEVPTFILFDVYSIFDSVRTKLYMEYNKMAKRIPSGNCLEFCKAYCVDVLVYLDSETENENAIGDSMPAVRKAASVAQLT